MPQRAGVKPTLISEALTDDLESQPLDFYRPSVMQSTAAIARIFVSAALLIASGATGSAEELSAAPLQPGVWQHHQATLLYDGITTHYTCDGLEDKVRSLLLYLGARADQKVRAFGCSGGLNHPSRIGTVSTDFYSLAAADAATDAAQTVPGKWFALTIAPNRPNWMGDGECELVEQLKSLLTKNFSIRDVDYRTTCIPHQVTIADYSVKGEILKPASVSGPPAQNRLNLSGK
jgi:hypothetical protein